MKAMCSKWIDTLQKVSSPLKGVEQKASLETLAGIFKNPLNLLTAGSIVCKPQALSYNWVFVDHFAAGFLVDRPVAFLSVSIDVAHFLAARAVEELLAVRKVFFILESVGTDLVVCHNLVAKLHG